MEAALSISSRKVSSRVLIDQLDVKHWPEIKNPQKYAGKELFIGSVTDPYNPQEEIYGRTRALLTQLQGSGAKISIATKSDLILRDLELIKSFPNARVSKRFIKLA